MDKPGQELQSSARAEFVEIDHRLKNVEQIVDVVKHVSDQAVDSWSQYLEQKTQQAKSESAFEDAQHQRAVKALIYVVSLVFVLAIVAMLKDQYGLVQSIIGSAIAVAAGAGLRSMFRGSRGAKS